LDRRILITFAHVLTESLTIERALFSYLTIPALLTLYILPE